MRYFKLPYDELDVILDKLYEECQEYGAVFFVHPALDVIDVFECVDNDVRERIAHIDIIRIDEPYQIKEIFN